jgi:hypothetical protein
VTERGLRSRVIKHLETLGAFAVENGAGVGAPDVCTVVGWIELKLAKLPVGDKTPVRVDLRPAQRIWLRRWATFGGVASVLTGVSGRRGHEYLSPSDTLWLLHPGSWACEFLGKAGVEDLKRCALTFFHGGLDAGSLAADLRKYHDTTVGPR